MAKFFIDRPIFAIVLSLIIMLAGALSIFGLPIEQFPPISPPTIQISTSFPGASAMTMESDVVQQIEQQMSNLDHLLYMSSTTDDTGQSVTTLTFETGTNPDTAQVQVQSKLELAEPRLPVAVTQSGIKVTKSTSSFLMVLGFASDDGSMTKFDIADYVASNIYDPISRTAGVGDLTLFGTQYAMRIWLDPAKMYSYALTPNDVSAALTDQNVQLAGGQLGGTPSPASQHMQATITSSTLLRTPEQFGRIQLKVQQDGSIVRLKDVARIALGAENYNANDRYDGLPASGLAIQLAPGANEIDTSKAIRARIAELQPYFPHGLQVVYPNDVTPFVKKSIEEVVKTLIEGIVLVFLVMLLFLQNLRATLIPTITVPVVLLGTFGIMNAIGFTINTLTMFGLVLAIGLLVDDAIVVVENVERVMEEEGLSPLEATRKAMSQISSALIGVALVLSAVFVPVAFSSGTIGAIYRQFSLTVVASMLLSVFVALSLTPALCAMILQPPQHGPKKGFFGWFNRTFDLGRDRYVGGVRGIIGRTRTWMVVWVVIIGAVIVLFLRLPSGFLPNEDQGYIYGQVQTPPGATQDQTDKALQDVSDWALKDQSKIVDHTFTLAGTSFSGNGQNQGRMFFHFRDWDERSGSALSAVAFNKAMAEHFADYKGAKVTPVDPPPIRGLGAAAGFDLMLEDRANLGHDRLNQIRDQLLALARKDPHLTQVRYTGQDDTPEFALHLDNEKAQALGVTVADINSTFSTAFGSKYVNLFLDTDNRIKKVYVQNDEPFRMTPDDIRNLYVRNKAGAMVPFSAFSTMDWSYGSPSTLRYNGVEAVEIQGKPAEGEAAGDAMNEMKKLVAQLPKGVEIEWTGISLQQELAGSSAPLFYALSILVVFLSLAALYESWSIPVAVIMVVPIGVIGALASATLFHMENDLYFQVGLLTTIGLSAKNAILIVEFARELYHQGYGAVEAAVEAAKLRLRPIIMTSLAFVLGVLPLAIATGAGANSERAIGTGVIGGMLTATFLATFMIPMFYVLITNKFTKRKAPAGAAAPVHETPAGAH
jgi:multidrug efflux pump